MQLSSNLREDCSLLFWETLLGNGHHFRNLLKAMPLCWDLSPQCLYLSPPASCLSADSKPTLWCRLPITLLHVDVPEHLCTETQTILLATAFLFFLYVPV